MTKQLNSSEVKLSAQTWMSSLPQIYKNQPQTEIIRRGLEAKSKLGDDVIILAHHYQCDETYSFSDLSGDSLYLARQAAKTSAKFIIFCGVHFMAESSDILTNDDQITILPEFTAGCEMADMAKTGEVEKCLDYLTDVCGIDSFIPITYINSTASLKALCGRHNGTVCTSSNSHKILKWAADKGKRVLFVPDQHLGRNTANALGIPKHKIKVWDRNSENGDLSREEILDSQIILWNGCCPVHCHFKIEEIRKLRESHPDIKVIVHPECPEEILAESDYSGSTDGIIKTIKDSTSFNHWAIGTESNLVRRLAKNLSQSHGKRIEFINEKTCVCDSMNITRPEHVTWILENLLEGNILNKITVANDIKQDAKIALNRMLDLS
ncbi:quinolinate synthase NadA [bacterium]|nr:quinolinate synthase NadA [bacterium]